VKRQRRVWACPPGGGRAARAVRRLGLRSFLPPSQPPDRAGPPPRHAFRAGRRLPRTRAGVPALSGAHPSRNCRNTLRGSAFGAARRRWRAPTLARTTRLSLPRNRPGEGQPPAAGERRLLRPVSARRRAAPSPALRAPLPRKRWWGNPLRRESVVVEAGVRAALRFSHSRATGEGRGGDLRAEAHARVRRPNERSRTLLPRDGGGQTARSGQERAHRHPAAHPPNPPPRIIHRGRPRLHASAALSPASASHYPGRSRSTLGA
jgi:hypothetical protein